MSYAAWQLLFVLQAFRAECVVQVVAMPDEVFLQAAGWRRHQRSGNDPLILDRDGLADSGLVAEVLTQMAYGQAVASAKVHQLVSPVSVTAPGSRPLFWHA